MERAFLLNPQARQVLITLASQASKLGEYEKAEEHLQQLADFAPGDPFAQFARANNTASWQGWEAAAAFAAWHALVALYLGDHQESLAHIERVPTQGVVTHELFYPTDLLRAWVYDAMGDASLAASSYESALVSLERAIEQSPDNARIESSLGLALAGLGHKDEAIRHGQRGVGLNRSAQTKGHRLWHLAQIYARVGKADAMLDTLEELLSNPSRYHMNWVEAEPAFEPYRVLARYEQLVIKYSPNRELPSR